MYYFVLFFCVYSVYFSVCTLRGGQYDITRSSSKTKNFPKMLTQRSHALFRASNSRETGCLSNFLGFLFFLQETQFTFRMGQQTHTHRGGNILLSALDDLFVFFVFGFVLCYGLIET